MEKKKAIAFLVLTTLIVGTLGVLLSAAPMAASGTGSMQAFWRMDTGSGSEVVDSSDSMNNGELSGGKFGNALEFDGVDDYVEVPSKPNQYGMSQLTIEAWIYPTTNDWQIVLAKWENGNTEDKASYALEIYVEKIYALVKTDGNTYVEGWNQGVKIIPINGIT